MIRKSFWLLLCLICLAILGAVGFYWIFGDLPSPDSLADRLNIPSVRITDRHGRLLYEVLAENGGRHAVVPLDSIPKYLQQATIATEDSRFYTNPGVDILGILRALWINLQGGETLAGGSTITQQVARNLLLNLDERTERSVRRKLRESYLAWKLARRNTKDEVLALYLNQIYYGGLAYGVEAASQTYFGKPVSELDLAECSLLAGLPQAPALYNPFTDLKAAQKRQQIVLELMEQEGFITPDDRLLAGREPLVLAATPYPIEAPHFVMMVRAELDSTLTPEKIYQHGGLIIRTSLDLDWQHHAEAAVARQLEALKRSDDGFGHNVNNAALVALDPQSGEILALVGSPDYFDAVHAGAINMAVAPRQPGSAIKPLVYAAALDPSRPRPWTPATMLLDVRTSFVTHDEKAYIPANYDRTEHGPVLLREALASSLNIPAVITLDHIGLDTLFEMATDLGISTLQDPDRYDLSLALGGGEVRLLELTNAYAAFANGGYRTTPNTILEIGDLQGNTVYVAQPAVKVRVLDERAAWLISDILSDNDARTLGFGPNSVLRIDRPAAVKTGTTTNFHDNWTLGYTPDLVVGVWAGNTSYEPMREVNGLTGAAPIWHQFIRTVLTGRPQKTFNRPPGMVRVEVCALSGLLPTGVCPYRRLEWFIAGTQPREHDVFYRQVTIDTATGLAANETTPPERQALQTVLDLPPQAQPWARTQGLTLLNDILPAGTADNQALQIMDDSALRLVSPPANAIYLIAPGFSEEAQRLRMQAVAAGGVNLVEVTFWIDNELVETFGQGSVVNQPFEAFWPLSPGVHQAWAEGITNTGERIESERVPFEVRAETQGESTQ